jgi:hypothetical protein
MLTSVSGFKVFSSEPTNIAPEGKDTIGRVPDALDFVFREVTTISLFGLTKILSLELEQQP